jgi:RNA polymerase sigma-70 factor (ECF subfamily)
VARDAVEAAYTRAVRRLHTFRGESKPRTWFFQIVHNEVFRLVELTERRRSRADEIHFSDEPSRRTALHERSAPEQQWSEQLPDRSSLDPLTGMVVEETVQSLPPTQREIYERVDREGMHPHEVADLSGISKHNVSASLHAARRKIRDALG